MSSTNYYGRAKTSENLTDLLELNMDKLVIVRRQCLSPAPTSEVHGCSAGGTKPIAG